MKAKNSALEISQSPPANRRGGFWWGFLFLFLLILFYFSLPSPLFLSPTSFVIEDENGELLSASIAKDGQWRFPAADTVPDKFVKCITAFEDSRFFYHPGVDPVALARAIRQNIESKKVVSGGSTLTMQVIRLSRKKPRTLWNKLKEALLAVRLELSYSKNQILNLYASNAPFGTNVVGLEAAAWRYFGRGADKLSWAETATLAVLPNSPSLVHPGRNRESLIRKRNHLLDKLYREKTIDLTTAELAKLERIPQKPLSLPEYAPHLLTRFKKDYKSLGQKTTRIRTTIKADLQMNVSRILQGFHQTFKSNGINNAAALVLDIETGKVLSYVGNIRERDPEMESDVDMIPAFRSPGSTLKPLLYASLLADGLILPNTLIPDIPTQIAGYTPQNFDLGYDGAIPASRALSRSLNIPAVKMLQQYKYQRFYEQLKKLGITSLSRPADFYGLSLILGGCEVSMWELSGIYASLARSLNHVTGNSGKYNVSDYHMPVYVKTEEKNRVIEKSYPIDHASVYFTFKAMQEVMRPGEEMLWEQFSSSQKIAWKTGTSFGFRDGWAIGLNTKNLVCVWIGNADGEGRPGLTGIETAAPVLFDIFELLAQAPPFKAPDDKLVQVEICKQSGYRADINCPDKKKVLVPTAGVKTKGCPYHEILHLDPTGTYRVTSKCLNPGLMVHKSWFILPPAMEYYYKSRHREYLPVPSFLPSCNDEESFRTLELIYPRNYGQVYIPVEIDGKRGKAIFHATHRNPQAKVFWHLNERYIATTEGVHKLSLSPPAGKYSLTLVDEEGNRLVQAFEVLDKERN